MHIQHWLKYQWCRSILWALEVVVAEGAVGIMFREDGHVSGPATYVGLILLGGWKWWQRVLCTSCSDKMVVCWDRRLTP